MRRVLLFSILVMLCLNLWQVSKDAHSPVTANAISAPSPQALTPRTPTIAPPLPQQAPTPTPTSTSQSPALPHDPVIEAAAHLKKIGLRPDYAGQYVQAATRTGTPWQIIAAVHHIESNQSGDTPRTSSAGAIGPMQFMPATFRTYGLDGDGDGVTRITDVNDAIYSAAHYLAVNGAARGRVQDALFAYNHSSNYVNKCLSVAVKLGY